MTTRDVIWLFATMLFVGGTVTTGMILWQMHRDQQEQRQQEIRDRLVSVHPASHYRVIPRPPYDWQEEQTDG